MNQHDIYDNICSQVEQHQAISIGTTIIVSWLKKQRQHLPFYLKLLFGLDHLCASAKRKEESKIDAPRRNPTPSNPCQHISHNSHKMSTASPSPSKSAPVRVPRAAADYTPAVQDPDLRSQINAVLLRDGHIAKYASYFFSFQFPRPSLSRNPISNP